MSTTPPTTDAKLTDLAKLAQDVSSTDGSKSWIWQLIAGAILGISAWYMQWQLKKKEAELAKANKELENLRLDAQVALAKAKVDASNAESQRLQEEANKHLQEALAQEATVKAAMAVNDEHQKTLAKIKNFEELNKILGIK